MTENWQVWMTLVGAWLTIVGLWLRVRVLERKVSSLEDREPVVVPPLIQQPSSIRTMWD